jgi:hypothetical protein
VWSSCGSLESRNKVASEGQERAMSLSYGQQRKLRRIEAGLRRSDPHLGGMHGMFARLYAGQNMPASEQATSGPGRSRLPAWLTAVPAVITTLLAAVCAAGRRARPPASGPEHTRHGREGGDQRDPPEPR